MSDTRARELRRNMTDAERVLWSVLRRKQLSGFRFRRQVQIGPYIADFVCPKMRLVIEVDGGQHSQEENALHDYLRTKFLEAHGYRVFRVWNDDVFRGPGDVAGAIYHALTAPPSGRNARRFQRRCAHLPPASRREGEKITHRRAFHEDIHPPGWNTRGCGRTCGGRMMSGNSSVAAQTSASTRSGDAPSTDASGVNATIWSSSSGKAPT